MLKQGFFYFFILVFFLLIQDAHSVSNLNFSLNSGESIIDPGSDFKGVISDRNALIKIYNTSSSKYLLPSWANDNIPFSLWEGVTTDIEEGTGSTGRVIKLNLNYRLLHELDPAIGDLTLLRELDLGRNDLSSLPSELYSLENLTDLYLDFNFLDFDFLIPCQKIASNYIFRSQTKIPIKILKNSLQLDRKDLEGKELYQWYENDKKIPGETKFELSNLNHGSIYYCRISNQSFSGNSGFEIESESIFIYNENEDIHNYELVNKNVNVYPNPTRLGTEINIDFDVPIVSNSESKLYIFDLNGRLVKKQDVNTNSVKINTLGFKSGLYILKYHLNGNSGTMKIVLD